MQATPEPPDIASWKAASESERHINVRFLSFGASQGARIQGKIPAYRFENDAEREAAVLLAVEAMLVYGSFYDGPQRPDGYHRFFHAGRVFIKSDFGL
ncbi:hypothetical protein [Hoeflea sp.]|uniref:hypothetical protein n=1 Tax=Hoeflea sp. TaxID=1940281 RepID=UPI0019ADF425|nr:hypothetical protein [Hoeflea sp.]MBC7281648.1 hypothetical protein [Hoeflea sp.]